MKKSKYINVIKYKNRIFLFNSFNNAIIEIDSEEKKTEILEKLEDLPTCSNEEIENYRKLGLIIPNTINEKLIIEENYQRNKYNSETLGLKLYPSFFCNLKCPYCFIKCNKNDIKSSKKNVNNYYKTIRNLLLDSDYKNANITILGGEPLLFVDELNNFIKSIRKLKTTISIITNGSVKIDKDNLNEILSYKKIKQFQISFDGNKKTHDNKKGLDGAYNNAIDFINKVNSLQYTGIIVIRLNITPENLNEMSELFSDLGTKVKHFENVIFSPAIISDTTNDGFKRQLHTCKEEYIMRDTIYDLLNSYKFEYSHKLTPLLYNCSFYNTSSFVVDPNLLLYKCDDLVNSEKNSIGKIEHNKLKLFGLSNKGRASHFRKFADSFLSDNVCKNCKWLPICRGGCPIELNRFESCKESAENRVKLYIKHKFIK